MASNDDDPFQRLFAKLARLAPLDDDDRRAVAGLPFKVVTVGSGHYLVREGDKPEVCCLLLRGYACRHKATSAGDRQIVSFHMPGDLLDVQHILLTQADHNVQTIGEAVVALIPAAALKRVARERSALNEALWRDSLIDASIFREWVLNVGRRDARSRIAHMLCEFAVRRRAAGLGEPERFEMPMTQNEIADATGLTSVHVNRMLQSLKEEGVLERNRGLIVIHDWNRLRDIADFDPEYLHAAA